VHNTTRPTSTQPSRVLTCFVVPHRDVHSTACDLSVWLSVVYDRACLLNLFAIVIHILRYEITITEWMKNLQELLNIRERANEKGIISSPSPSLVSTAIGLRKHRIPFDLRS
jgi:hypothetical protein